MSGTPPKHQQRPADRASGAEVPDWLTSWSGWGARSRFGAVGGVVVLALILVAIFADVLAPYPFDEVNLRDLLKPPSAEHLMGTDQLGRDYLSRNIHGARISMFVGLLATSLNVVVAVLIGGTAGFFGGKLDLVVQRVVDAWMAFRGCCCC